MEDLRYATVFCITGFTGCFEIIASLYNNADLEQKFVQVFHQINAILWGIHLPAPQPAFLRRIILTNRKQAEYQTLFSLCISATNRRWLIRIT